VMLCTMFVLTGISRAENTGKVAGSVKNRTTGEPLIDATVMIEGTLLGARADVNGDFFIINIPPGVYRVTASYVGFRRMTQTDVRVRIDQTTALTFELTEESVEAEAVTVVAERPKVELDLTARKTSMSR